jgi:type III secretion system low calcium response chaperone LcrH/SycD
MTDKAMEQLREMATNAALGALAGEPLKIAKGISDEELNAVYSLAYSYYNTGRYDEALKLFKFLVLLDHMSQKFWTGLGSVYQVMKKWDEAIAAYAQAMVFDVSRPKPIYYAALCYFAKGEKLHAASSVVSFDLCCKGSDPETVKFRAKIDALRAAIGPEAFAELDRIDKAAEAEKKAKAGS